MVVKAVVARENCGRGAGGGQRPLSGSLSRALSFALSLSPSPSHSLTLSFSLTFGMLHLAFAYHFSGASGPQNGVEECGADVAVLHSPRLYRISVGCAQFTCLSGVEDDLDGACSCFQSSTTLGTDQPCLCIATPPPAPCPRYISELALTSPSCMGAESLQAEATGDTGNEEMPRNEAAVGIRAFDCAW